MTTVFKILVLCSDSDYGIEVEIFNITLETKLTTFTCELLQSVVKM